MTRSRTPIEAAAGKLIAAIQKEWGVDAGEPESPESENVMHSAHELLQAASKFGSIASVIGSGSVSTFLGEEWVGAHPRVLPFIAALESTE
ncbi:hypothetical protein FB547_12263 [Variovorax beijingensis]|uniref:Uncharacterized protein n=2 Tax=Variovorax TaxID=34072 RepID=A0AAE4BZ71_VARPD|nr:MULTISPECIES: hypothetical protein [Variovorax]MDP9968082.1 hypothetical protein [Variovorax paradoxus]MDR6429841.1 hypothetical protein [Variovorax paradoxus]MDR6456222.1 hypothetical protein [Variovorax paradoxus]TWD73571.1 hypothetical protein FB547_12263 [Variovorax beijingensis]